MTEKLRVCRLPKGFSNPNLLAMVGFNPWSFLCHKAQGTALLSMIEPGCFVPHGHCIISRAFGECGRGHGKETLTKEEQEYLQGIEEEGLQ